MLLCYVWSNNNPKILGSLIHKDRAMTAKMFHRFDIFTTYSAFIMLHYAVLDQVFLYGAVYCDYAHYLFKFPCRDLKYSWLFSSSGWLFHNSFLSLKFIVLSKLMLHNPSALLARIFAFLLPHHSLMARHLGAPFHAWSKDRHLKRSKSEMTICGNIKVVRS